MRITFIDIKNNRLLHQFEQTGGSYIPPREGETFAVHQPRKPAYAEWAEFVVRELLHLHCLTEAPQILVLCVPQKQDRVATERIRGLLGIGGKS